nr:MAG: hypothetical protein [Metapenaeopsis lamellata majanivirus]
MSKSKNIDFISIVTGINSQSDISKKLAYVLKYQDKFDKRISPWEFHKFRPIRILKKIKIEVEHIDRLYRCFVDEQNMFKKYYEMLARMNYNGRKIYVALVAFDLIGYGACRYGGIICICYDVNIFTKFMLNYKRNNSIIYHTLRNDTCLDIYEQTEFDCSDKKLWRNVPTLKYLCLEKTRKNLNKIGYQIMELPQILKKNLDDLCKNKQTQKRFIQI